VFRVTDAWVEDAKGKVIDANLRIISWAGNVICTDRDGICSATTPENCALPCLIGGQFTKRWTDPDTGLVMPGLFEAGQLAVRVNNRVLPPEANDKNWLEHADKFRFRYEDTCNASGQDVTCPKQPRFGELFLLYPE
jgi:hypothetical protein